MSDHYEAWTASVERLGLDVEAARKMVRTYAPLRSVVVALLPDVAEYRANLWAEIPGALETLRWVPSFVNAPCMILTGEPLPGRCAGGFTPPAGSAPVRLSDARSPRPY